MEEEILVSSSSSSSSSSSPTSEPPYYHHHDGDTCEDYIFKTVKLRSHSNQRREDDCSESDPMIPPAPPTRPHTLAFGSTTATNMDCSDQLSSSSSPLSLSTIEMIDKTQGEEVENDENEVKDETKLVIAIGQKQQQQQQQQKQTYLFDNNNNSSVGEVDSRSVKIKVNDLTPSSSQEFIGPSVGGRRTPGTPSSLVSSVSGSPVTTPSPLSSTSPPVPPTTPTTTPITINTTPPTSNSSCIITTPTTTTTTTSTTSGQAVISTIGGTTAKRCAKRNSSSALPGLTNTNHPLGGGSFNHNKHDIEPIPRRKSWSSATDQSPGNNQSEYDDENDAIKGKGSGPHRIISLSSLDSDLEETFYDARESDSPKKRNDKGQSSSTEHHNQLQQLTNFTLTRYSSVSASRLDDIVNTCESMGSQSPDSPFGQTRIGIAVSSTDIVTSTLSSGDEPTESQINVIPIEKPRSLSASSSETIFNTNHPNHHQLSSITSQQSIRKPVQSSMTYGCARSMNDIMATDRCPSPKSGSNSSSRESISPQSTSSTVIITSNNNINNIPINPNHYHYHYHHHHHQHPSNNNTHNHHTINTTATSSSDSNFISNCKQFLTSTTSKIMPTSTIKSTPPVANYHQHSPSHHPNYHHHHQYLTPPRTTLHKSISTPSILAAQEAAEEQSTSRERRDKNLSYISNQESDDEKSISKRKKRGSLFFRKKRKDKDTKKVSPHQFVSVCYSIAALCDVCKKALANKPAIKCENCMVTVHDSSCKDQILDCNKFRLAKKPSHLALSTKDRTISPMLQVPPGRHHYHPLRGFPSLHECPDMEEFPIPIGSNVKSSSPTSSVKDKKLGGFCKSHQSSSHTLSSSHDSQGITCKPPSSSSPSKVICEDKELDTGEDGHSNIVETNSGSMESLDEGVAEIVTSEFEDDSFLKLLDDEPESWNNTVDKKVLKRLKEKDIKRQEVIHELIITEKHHCLTLKIMQKIYAQGMIKELHMTKDMVERIFPCLEDLLETHLTFLKKLRERQSLDSVIDSIGDIILQQFSGSNGEQLRNCYGQFCSQHKEALSLYKDILKTDRKFQTFIKKCSAKPLCKTRGIPECILLVTQRITKYPLLIDSLLKVTKDTKCDYLDLREALRHIKDVINRVDAQVAEKEKEIRLLEIYNKIDAKSTTLYRGKKFRKSDLLSNNRKLRHEANISWKSARGKVVDVVAVVLSDVIILLQENNQKYHFCSLDNKSSVVSLQKLLVREKAGQLSRGVYLISSNPHEPEMYELICPTAKDQKLLIDQTREAVEMCPDEDEEGTSGSGSVSGVHSEGEERKIEEARKAKVRELLNSMYEKDARMAQMCEDKMKIFADMMELLGIEQEGLELIRYVPIIEDNCSPETIINAANEAFRIAHSLYISGTNLCRSVSSAGEHQSDTFVSPILPKRAETFGGFDNPEKDPTLRFNALKKKLTQLKDCAFKETDGSMIGTAGGIIVTSGDRASSSGIGSGRITEAESDGSGLNNIVGSTSLSSSSVSSTNTGAAAAAAAAAAANPNESFLSIRPTITEIRRSSGPVIGSITNTSGVTTSTHKSCSSSTSSPEKYQRRSLVTTPTPSIQSLFTTSSSNTLAPHSPLTSSSSSMFATLPLYDPSDIYRLTTTPLLMTQGKDQLIQIAELQHQVNLLMCLFNYQQTLFENMRFQLMDSNNKIIQLQKDNIYSTTHSSSISGGGIGLSSSGGGIIVGGSGGGKGDYGLTSSMSSLSQSSSTGTGTTTIQSKPDRRSVYRPEQGLEELRNLQEQLRCEKSDWIKKLNEEKNLIEEERKSLEELKESIRREQKDVEEQRETLYRKLEALQKEGIILSPAHTIVNTSNLSNRGNNGFHNSGGGSSGSGLATTDQCDDRLQLTRSIGLNNISTGSTQSDNLMNQLSSSTPATAYAFNNINNNVIGASNVIKQQLPLKLAVNEPGQGRCNHSQVVNSSNNQQLPSTIGNIPHQTR